MSGPAKRAKNFYPRPPRGGRPTTTGRHGVSTSISIHALREEGDAAAHAEQPTAGPISIHALREEGDETPRPMTSK